MELDSATMYHLEVIDLNSEAKAEITALGSELAASFDFLRIGQVVNDWKMYVVVPLCGEA